MYNFTIFLCTALLSLWSLWARPALAYTPTIDFQQTTKNTDVGINGCSGGGEKYIFEEFVPTHNTLAQLDVYDALFLGAPSGGDGITVDVCAGVPSTDSYACSSMVATHTLSPTEWGNLTTYPTYAWHTYISENPAISITANAHYYLRFSQVSGGGWYYIPGEDSGGAPGGLEGGRLNCSNSVDNSSLGAAVMEYYDADAGGGGGGTTTTIANTTGFDAFIDRFYNTLIALGAAFMVFAFIIAGVKVAQNFSKLTTPRV